MIWNLEAIEAEKQFFIYIINFIHKINLILYNLFVFLFLITFTHIPFHNLLLPLQLFLVQEMHFLFYLQLLQK